MANRDSTRPARSRGGFTFMEILAALLILVAFCSIALENVNNFFSGQRTQAEALTFIQDVRAARYGAMASQFYHRLMFRGDGLAYRVDVYDNAGQTTVADVSDALTNYSSPVWSSILDNDEREFDPEVTVEKPSSIQVIFMRPDGMLVSTPRDDAAPIGESIATFSYGASTLQVYVNFSGVMNSREYYEE